MRHPTRAFSRISVGVRPDRRHRKDHTCFIEVSCATDVTYRLSELWCVEHQLIEGYRQLVEQRAWQRDIDPNHEVLQIFTNPKEPQISENLDKSACWRRRTSASPVRTRSKGNEEIFEQSLGASYRFLWHQVEHVISWQRPGVRSHDLMDHRLQARMIDALE